MTTGRITYKDFIAEISYSAIGSGHYFTLTNLRGKLKSLIQFLNKYEYNYAFCIETHSEEVRDELTKRGYNPDERDYMRIGHRVISHEERLEIAERNTRSLTQADRTRYRATEIVKKAVKNKISKRLKQREAAE